MAAADAHNIGQKRLQYRNGVFVVTLCESLDATTERNKRGARRKLARHMKRLELCDPAIERGAVPGRRRDKRVVQVDKMTARVRKGVRPICGELAPVRLKTSLRFK